MHVFVTGATGFVGFHTVMALHKAGHSIRFGVRNAEKMKRLYAPYGIDTSDFAIGEITDAEAIQQGLQGCDAVVHTAAVVSMDPNKAEHMMHTNLTGTKLVIGGAVKLGIKSIVYVSSVAAIYDPNADIINEATPLSHPNTAYGKSKQQCEMYVRGLIDAGANIAITYPSAVVGPQDPAMSEGNQSIKIQINIACVNTSSGQQIIDVRDLAAVHVGLLSQSLSGRYVVGGEFLPWRELSATIDRVTQKTTRKLSVAKPLLMLGGILADWLGKLIPHNLPFSREAMMYATQWIYADDSKVSKALDITFRPIDETLRDTIFWLAETKHINPHWADNIDIESVERYPTKS